MRREGVSVLAQRLDREFLRAHERLAARRLLVPRIEGGDERLCRFRRLPEIQL